MKICNKLFLLFSYAKLRILFVIHNRGSPKNAVSCNFFFVLMNVRYILYPFAVKICFVLSCFFLYGSLHVHALKSAIVLLSGGKESMSIYYVNKIEKRQF